MIINNINLLNNSRVSFTTKNQFDTQTYVGVIIAIGNYAITPVSNNDVDNYHIQVLKTNAIVEDPKDQEYFIIKLDDGTLMAVGEEWVSEASFTVLDQSVDFYIVVRSVSESIVKTQILDMISAAGYDVSEYTPPS